MALGFIDWLNENGSIGDSANIAYANRSRGQRRTVTKAVRDVAPPPLSHTVHTEQLSPVDHQALISHLQSRGHKIVADKPGVIQVQSKSYAHLHSSMKQSPVSNFRIQNGLQG